jgi:hypothetical protein
MSTPAFTGVFALTCLFSAAACATPELQAELDRVKAERSDIEAQFEARNRQCYQKLQVNDCKRDVQWARSEALRPVTVRQRSLEAELRQHKAEAQRVKAQERREAHEQRGREIVRPSEAAPAQPPRQP